MEISSEKPVKRRTHLQSSGGRRRSVQEERAMGVKKSERKKMLKSCVFSLGGQAALREPMETGEKNLKYRGVSCHLGIKSGL